MRMRAVLAALAVIPLLQVGTVPASAGEKPVITKPCTNCHEAAAGVVRGMLTNLSNKMSSLQVNVGQAAWVFDFDDKTAFQNVEGVGKLQKDKEIAVTYKEVGGSLYASLIATKPKFEVAAEMLVDTAFVLELIKKSPADGGYVLVDARPGPKYEEGHIRHAVSMPLFAFDQKKDQVLPAKKDAVLVFYCGGVT